MTINIVINLIPIVILDGFNNTYTYKYDYTVFVFIKPELC